MFCHAFPIIEQPEKSSTNKRAFAANVVYSFIIFSSDEISMKIVVNLMINFPW